MNCPKCNSEMETGWLAVYESLPITRLVWQPVKPGWVRHFRIVMGQANRLNLLPYTVLRLLY